MAPLYSGYGIDVIMRSVGVNTDYVCQLHCDAFPIHHRWLSLAIKLIEENDFSFIGQLQFISQPMDTIYPRVPFFAMAQSFNVAKTTTYEEMSINAGFTRFHERPYVEYGIGWYNNDWAMWAKQDYNERGSDDDVIAFCWEDVNRQHDKLGLAITGYIEPSFSGASLMTLSFTSIYRESIGTGNAMGDQYKKFTETNK